uniref:Uncharacterized protein n=1 Tax=Cannabis sativa TaxID=3483 RepID=A0A803PQZ3_CANSA
MPLKRKGNLLIYLSRPEKLIRNKYGFVDLYGEEDDTNVANSSQILAPCALHSMKVGLRAEMMSLCNLRLGSDLGKDCNFNLPIASGAMLAALPVEDGGSYHPQEP